MQWSFSISVVSFENNKQDCNLFVIGTYSQYMYKLLVFKFIVTEASVSTLFLKGIRTLLLEEMT